MNIKNSEFVTEDFSLEIESDAEQGVVHFVVREFTGIIGENSEIEGIIEKSSTGVVLLVEQLEEFQIAINEAILHQQRTSISATKKAE